MSKPTSKFHHEQIYRGENLVEKLAGFRIVVCGGGAIGSNLVDNLVRQGFTNLCVIDMDRVETHNLGTQIFRRDDVGATKANAIQNAAWAATETEIEVIGREMTAENAKKFLKGASLVIDGFDNHKSRLIVQNACRDASIPCLHAGLSGDGYSEVVWDEVYNVPQDAEGDVCDYPLARNLVLVTVGLLTEEILDFCLQKSPRKRSLSFTLRDMRITNR